MGTHITVYKLSAMKTIVCLLFLVCLSSISEAHLLKKILKKFKGGLLKKFGDDEKKPTEVVTRKCDVIWEEKVTPLCKSVNHPQCHTEWRDECHKVWDTKCFDIEVDECTSEKRCEWITEKQCKTEYTVTCDDHAWRKKREVELPEDIADIEMVAVSEDELADPDVKKILEEPIDITDMSDDDIAKVLLDISEKEEEEATEEVPDEEEAEQESEVHDRSKRGAGGLLVAKGLGLKAAGLGAAGLGRPLLGAGLGAAGLGAVGAGAGIGLAKKGLIAAGGHHGLGLGSVGLGIKAAGGKLLKKGGKLFAPLFKKLGVDDKPEPIVEEQLCHHHPNTNCWDEPREKCWDEPVCHKVPKQKCEQIPREVCEKVDFERCQDVWEEQCEYMRVKVAKKHCRKPKW